MALSLGYPSSQQSSARHPFLGGQQRCTWHLAHICSSVSSRAACSGLAQAPEQQGKPPCLTSLACPASSTLSQSLHSVPLFLSLKMTPRSCRGRTSPASHLGPVTGLCPHTGCHSTGSWGRFESLGTNTITTGTMGTATHTVDTTAVCHGHCCTLHGHHRGSATSVGTHWHKPCTSHQGETLTIPPTASWL